MIVADHTKIGRLALAHLCGLEEVDEVVVDSGLNEASRSLLDEAARYGFTWRPRREP